MNKFLIIVMYYERANMLRKNALESIKRLGYNNWEMVFIDDGSRILGEPIVREVLPEYLHKIKFINTHDTIEDKVDLGGSRVGYFMNQAIIESDADLVMILCDDDAIIPDSLSKIDKWFASNPSEMYSYSLLKIYDPITENPFEVEDARPVFMNEWYGPVNGANKLDISQVIIKSEVWKNGSVMYNWPQTISFDMNFFADMANIYGLCPPNGVYVQYKAWFDDQLGKRNHSSIDSVYNPKDLK